MPEKVQKRYVKTPDTMLVALGAEPTRTNKVHLKYWRTFPDFPKREKAGWDVAKLREFIDRHKEEFASSAATAKFITAKPIPKSNDQGVAPGAGHEVSGEGTAALIKERYDRQAGIAGALQLYYGNRVRYVFSNTVVSKWINGTGLDPGVPPPPPKRPHHYIMAEWVEWFDKYLLPSWKHQTDAQGQLLPDLRRQADLAESRKLIDEARIKEIERENMEREHSDKWVLVQEAERTQTAVVMSIRNVVRSQNERGDVDALREQCRLMQLSAEQTSSLCAWMNQRGIGRMTAIEEQIAAQASLAAAPAEQSH